jgi:SAM-dependent methyltransferase
VSADSPYARALEACASGACPPNVALMRIFLTAPSAEAARMAISEAVTRADSAASASGAARLRALRELWERIPEAYERVASIAPFAYEPMRDAAECARLFDGAARISPQAAVALYTFGDAGLQSAATQEIVALLQRWALLHPHTVAVELGCGAGRFVAALAPHLARVVGVDISPQMLSAARAVTGDRANVLLVRTNGHDFAAFADDCCDLLLAVDSFPYLVEVGLAERHVQDAARLLRPRGALVILNFSYRADLGADQRDISALAARFGFDVLAAGERPFRHWDGTAFHLRRQPLA